MRLLALFLTIWAGIIGALAAPLQFAQSPPSWVLPGATVDLDFANQRYWRNGALTAIDRVLSYTRTNPETCQSSGGELSYVAANIPCITDLGYHAWLTATNLLLQSQFAASWTATRSTLTANAVTSPDGSVDAATLIEDNTVTSTHLATQSITKAASALPYAFSVYAKPGVRKRIDLQLDDNAGNGAVMVCDLDHQTTGVATAGVGTAFTQLSTNIYGYRNGWTRCAMSATSNTATTLVATVFLDNGTGTGAKSNSYSGDAASGVQLFGAQVENLAAFNIAVPSPYIPTTTASAARTADCASMSATVGPQSTMWAQGFVYTPAANTGAQDLLYIDDNTANNRNILRRTAATGIASGIVIIGGVTQYTATMGSALAQNASVQMAMAMAPGSQLVAANGTIGTQSNATILTTAINTMHIGCSTTSAAQWQGYVQRVAVLGNSFVGDLGSLTLR